MTVLSASTITSSASEQWSSSFSSSSSTSETTQSSEPYTVVSVLFPMSKEDLDDSSSCESPANALLTPLKDRRAFSHIPSPRKRHSTTSPILSHSFPNALPPSLLNEGNTPQRITANTAPTLENTPQSRSPTAHCKINNSSPSTTSSSGLLISDRSSAEASITTPIFPPRSTDNSSSPSSSSSLLPSDKSSAAEASITTPIFPPRSTDNSSSPSSSSSLLPSDKSSAEASILTPTFPPRSTEQSKDNNKKAQDDSSRFRKTVKVIRNDQITVLERTCGLFSALDEREKGKYSNLFIQLAFEAGKKAATTKNTQEHKTNHKA